MKKSLRALKFAAALGVAGALAFATPAIAGTVGQSTATFYSSPGDLQYSAVSNDGSKIAYSFYSSNAIYILDVATGVATPVTASPGVISHPAALEFSPNDQVIFVANYTGDNVLAVDVATASIPSTLNSFAFSGPATVNVTPDGRYVYVANYDDGNVVKYDLTNDTTTTALVSINLTASFMKADGSKIFFARSNGTIMGYDTATESTTDAFGGVSTTITNACVNSDLSVMYLPTKTDGSIYAVSLVDGTVVESIAVSGSHTTCTVSPDNTRLFLSNYDVGTIDPSLQIATSPGTVAEYTVNPLTFVQDYSMTYVAYTQQIDFVNACTAYVAGYNGNAQTIDFGGDCNGGGGGGLPELPNTGVDAAALAAVGGFAALAIIAGATVLVARRRTA